MVDEFREFDFRQKHFDFLRELARSKAGIALTEAKRELVYGRIARRIRALRLTGFDAYCDLLQNRPDDELGNFINAITTNLTSFCREEHHFSVLREQLVPHWVRTRGPRPSVRIWSAGCSTGEEPYSIAMSLLEAWPPGRPRDIQISATDIDTAVLEHASSGVYDLERVQGQSLTRLQRWFQKGVGSNDQKARLQSEVRDLVSFKRVNLMDSWPLRGPFDVIFCRNVVIYFDKPTQRRLFDRFADILAPDGHLIIGHSETLYGVSERFELIGRTIYRKAGSQAVR